MPIETVQMFCVIVSMLSSIIVYIFYGHGDRRVLQSDRDKSHWTHSSVWWTLCVKSRPLCHWVQFCVHHKAGSCGIFLLRYLKTQHIRRCNIYPFFFSSRCFFSINPERGTKVEHSKKRKVFAVNPRVLTLIADLADHEWRPYCTLWVMWCENVAVCFKNCIYWYSAGSWFCAAPLLEIS